MAASPASKKQKRRHPNLAQFWQPQQASSSNQAVGQNKSERHPPQRAPHVEAHTAVVGAHTDVETLQTIQDAHLADVDVNDDQLSRHASRGTKSAKAEERDSKTSPIPGSIAFRQAPRFARDTTTKDPATASSTTGPKPILCDKLPWSEQYAPESLAELAVHAKKVAVVRQWLENVTSGREKKKLLVLKGPAGSGKSVTISLLAKALGLSIKPWRNPTSTAAADGILSMASQFEDFMLRGTNYTGSVLEPSDPLAESSLQHNSWQGNGHRQSLVLIEEFPAVLRRDSNILKTFQETLLKVLALSVASPVVLIVSEIRTSEPDMSSEMLTAHRLLGPDIVWHPLTNVIEFNTVAPTLLRRALELVLVKEARSSRRRRVPGPDFLAHLSASGDLRSAIETLEFLCIGGTESDEWTGSVANLSSKKRPKTAKGGLSRKENSILKSIGQKGETLELFHAVGKVVYNKRVEPSELSNRTDLQAAADIPPPRHLSHLARAKVSEVDPEALFQDMATDSTTFVAALHENFPPSCNGADAVTYLNDCMDYLSDANIIAMDRSHGAGISSQVSSAFGPGLRHQQEMAFRVAVQGLLFSLPHPVQRSSRGDHGTSTSSSYQMSYPTSSRLWGLLDEQRSLLQDVKLHGRGHTSDHSAADCPSIRLDAARCSDVDLVLEWLPYYCKIDRASTDDRAAQAVRRLCTFGPATSGDPVTADSTKSWTTGYARKTSTFGQGTHTLASATEEQLLLSDDDIQDD